MISGKHATRISSSSLASASAPKLELETLGLKPNNGRPYRLLDVGASHEIMAQLRLQGHHGHVAFQPSNPWRGWDLLVCDTEGQQI